METPIIKATNLPPQQKPMIPPRSPEKIDWDSHSSELVQLSGRQPTPADVLSYMNMKTMRRVAIEIRNLIEVVTKSGAKVPYTTHIEGIGEVVLTKHQGLQVK